MSATSISFIASLLIGSIFLVTGLVKLLAPVRFAGNIQLLKLLPTKLTILSAFTFSVIECILGLCLILQISPQWILPGTFCLLLFLTALTYWSTSTGLTDDCGCYGGILEIQPYQSIMLNFFYMAGIVAGYLYPTSNIFSNIQQIIYLSIFIPIILIITAISYWYFKNNNKSIVDFSPLKINRHWQLKWLQEDSDRLTNGSHIVAFLSTTCEMCRIWVNVLNNIDSQGDLPNVLAVVDEAASLEEMEQFIKFHQIHFPIATMKTSTLQRLVEGFPTAVVIENGVIRDKWEAGDFIEQIQREESLALMQQ
jgi:hypothetical protein